MWESGNTVETVALLTKKSDLGKKKRDFQVEMEVPISPDMHKEYKEQKPTYENIKKYIMEKHGVKVHTAYEDMTLYPKDKAVLENGLLTRKQIDDMDTYRWRDGLYCFKNLSFDDVLKQFEIYYDIRFVKENPQIANPKLNGKFRLIDGVDYALRVLQREVGFSFRRDDEANVIYLK